MLTEKFLLDKIEILENKELQIRTVRIIYDDDKEISRIFHRKVLLPGDILEKEDQEVISLSSFLWTPEIIQRYKNIKAKEKI